MIVNAKKWLKNKFLKKVMGIPSRSKYKFIIKDWINLSDLNACSRVLETKRFSRNLQPIQLNCPTAQKILVIAPHTDDDILGAGGTLMKAIENGSEVHTLYVTKGIVDQTKFETVKNETIAVCNKIGLYPHFIECHNGEIPLDDDTVSNKIISLIKTIQPQAIFISFFLDDHDDHRRVNHLLLMIFKNYKIPKIEIWAYQIYSSVIPNVTINITNEAEKKKELIHMWKSISGNRDWAHYMLGINAANCRYISSKTPLYVETFFVVPIDEYLELCHVYFDNNTNDIYYGDYYRNNSSKDNG